MNAAAIAELLPRLHPLTGLGTDSLRELSTLCLVDRVAHSQDPMKLFDWNSQVVYLARGEIKLDFADGSFEIFVGGSGSALLPLGRGGRPPVRTKAITEIELLRIDADAVDIAVTWDQLAVAGAVDGEADWRTLSGIFAVQSMSGGAFAALPPAHIKTLLERFQRVAVKRGEVVIRQGAAGDYYYVIERGRCLVTRAVAGATVELAELKGGDAFGEEALIADAVRNATVTMKSDGELLRLGQVDFSALLKEPLLHRLSPGEAVGRIAAGATWLDVRFTAEYMHDGMRGAINIPLNELRQALALLDAQREYVVYCQSGRRSSAAAFLLSQRGYRAHLLEGGLKAFAAVKENT